MKTNHLKICWRHWPGGVLRALAALLISASSMTVWAAADAPGMAVQQQKNNEVTGLVTDQNNEPLIGVSVKIVGADGSTGAITDIDGIFHINVADKNASLEFSYIGYKTKVVKLSGQKLLNVALEEELNAKVAEVEAREQELNAYQEDLDGKYTELETLSDEVKGQLDSTNSSINAETGKLKDYDSKLKDLDATMKSLESQTAAAQAKLAQQIAERLAMKKEDTSGSYAASASELEWLAATIQAEADGESYTGKLAVGSVIMNRVKSSAFPNDVRGVITQSMQFASYRSGKVELIIAKGPNSTCINAAQEVLNGARVGDYLFFMTKYYADYYGISEYEMIGNHAFFYRWVVKEKPPAEEPGEPGEEPPGDSGEPSDPGQSAGEDQGGGEQGQEPPVEEQSGE